MEKETEKELKRLLESIAYLIKCCKVTEELAASMFQEAYRACETPSAETSVDAEVSEGIPHIIREWISDADYVDELGEPLAICSKGEMPSLEYLTDKIGEKYDLEIDVESVKSLLCSTGAAVETVDNRVRLKTKHFKTSTPGSKDMHRVMVNVGGHLHTTVKNIQEGGGGVFERYASHGKCSVANIPRLNELSRDAGMQFLETVDEILMTPAKDGEKTTKAGIGVYVYYDD